MTPEQIISGIFIGSLTIFLVNWLGLQVKVRLIEAIVVGMMGAWAGELLLSPMLAGTQIDRLLLVNCLAAMSAEMILLGLKTGWNEFQKLQQPRAWSFVQPFEE